MSERGDGEALRMYSVAAIMTRRTPEVLTYSLYNGYVLALNADEATGMMTKHCRELKPGFDIGDLAVSQILDHDMRRALAPGPREDGR